MKHGVVTLVLGHITISGCTALSQSLVDTFSSSLWSQTPELLLKFQCHLSKFHRSIESAYATSYSNFGPISPRFRDIPGFLLRTSTPPLFYPNFGNVPLGPDCRYCDSYGSEDLTLIARVINFELVQSIHPRYSNVADRQTDVLQ